MAAAAASSSFTPVNAKSQTSQRTFYEDHDSNDREPMPSEAHAGNCTRTIQGPFVRAPVANMTPRKSIWEVPEVEEAPAFDMRRNPKAFDATANKPAIADESDSNSQDSSFLPDQPTRHSSGSRDSEDPNNQVNGNQNNTAKRMTEHDAEEDEVPDGEYEVEAIHGHKYVKRALKLEVKWKGYGKEENTFEDEDNLRENAADILDAYFEEIGERPERKVSTARLRKNTRSKSEQKHTPPTRRQTSESSNKTEDDYVIPSPPSDEPEPWQPPPVEPGSWEHLVMRVDHLQRLPHNCIVYIYWFAQNNRGERYYTNHEYWAVKIAAPASLFAYFEQHLSFDNTELRGIPQEAVKPPIDQLKKSRSNIGHNSLKRPADGSQTSIPLHSKKSKH